VRCIIDLEQEVNADIDELIALKKEISAVINRVPNVDYRMLLELRYLTFKPWRAIVSALRCNKDYIFQMHRAALAAVIIPEKPQ
jgi:hypothetical protein